MAYKYDDDEDEDEAGSRSAEEMLPSLREQLEDIEDRTKTLIEAQKEAAAAVRLELIQNRREMAEVRATLARLQTRFDNQLTTLVVANIASGIGVAALVVGASHAF